MSEGSPAERGGDDADILRAETEGPDRVLSSPRMRAEQKFGRGFMVPPHASPAGVATFGHDGAGGSLGFADPERRVAFGYAMTRMFLGPHEDPRATALVRALYDSLA